MTTKPSSAVHELSSFVTPLLTDYYQVSMAYAYWKGNRHEEDSVFDVYFRKNPFKGEYTIFAGLQEVLTFVANYKFSDQDIEYLEKLMGPNTDPNFLTWLAQVDCKDVRIYAVKEGSVVFPRVPLLRIEGPLAICQLLETTILNLTNFASLIATNAARMRVAAGPEKKLLEFGLRRAQGPNGAMSASKYAYIGGFDGTSNCLAGSRYGIHVGGTHAHSFVCSFKGPEDLNTRKLDGVDVWNKVLTKRKELSWENTNVGELAAFVAYALSFPDGFLALVDTYDTLSSGVPNFLVVASVLLDLGRTPKGIRLDSGDLAYLSKEARKMFKKMNSFHKGFDFTKLNIVASNDINEKVLYSLRQQEHDIDTFGIGTNLVTCQAQPALGMVYKLVHVNSRACIKLSNEFTKVTLPGRKTAFRFYNAEKIALCDFMIKSDEAEPGAGKRILCQHPTSERKKMYVVPTTVEALHSVVFDNGKKVGKEPSIAEIREFAIQQLKLLQLDHIRNTNPTPYKVSVSTELYDFIQDIWSKNAPTKEIR